MQTNEWGPATLRVRSRESYALARGRWFVFALLLASLWVIKPAEPERKEAGEAGQSGLLALPQKVRHDTARSI